MRIYDARRKEMVRKKRKVGIKQRSGDDRFTIRAEHYWETSVIREDDKISITLCIECFCLLSWDKGVALILQRLYLSSVERILRRWRKDDYRLLRLYLSLLHS